MKKTFTILSLLICILVSVAFTDKSGTTSEDNLRRIYSGPSSAWPKPTVDAGIEWKELGSLPASPIDLQNDSIKNIVELGKALFFDTRLSSSEKISCATCHQPELNWTDGKEKSVGHEGAINKRNSPTIQNSWFYKKLFWDGRAKDLQDQAFAPINSETEMHSEMQDIMRKLRKSKSYPGLFEKAFGDDAIDPDRMTEAIATFEKTITSGKSRFDEFIEGKKKALTNSELRGLHLFRTKARCMNCHNGPMFSDNNFHNNGFHLNGNPENDKGLYAVTHKDDDIGKFKTPSLRDVARTGPWMHNGMMKTITDVLLHYNKGANGNGGAERIIKMLYLDKKEISDLAAFLNAISAPPVTFTKPVLPE